MTDPRSTSAINQAARTVRIEPESARPLAMEPHSKRSESSEPSGSTGDCFAPVDQIDHALGMFIDSLDLPSNLCDAIRYSLLGGGKRLRPLLAWHAAHAVGDPQLGLASVPSGIAVELVHAFSLVHDDLPAMDDDDLRRGRPTLHVHAGEAMAILAGDAMLNLATHAILRGTLGERPGRADAAVQATELLTELVAGTGGMIAGQVYDTLAGFPEGLPDHERLQLVHVNKTGALLRASVRMGSLAGLQAARDGEPAGLRVSRDDAMRAITGFGDAIGLMYQIVDDLLDVEQTDEHLGKRAGKDQDAGKLTYPGVLGVEASRAEIERLRRVAHESLGPLGERSARLAELADLMAARTR